MSDDEPRLRGFEAKAEQGYDAMFEARNTSTAIVCDSNVKEYSRDAIGLAHRTGAVAPLILAT
jgi:hypothetical protein